MDDSDSSQIAERDDPPLGDLLDRALGAYLGLAIGDALGATVEFMMPREIAHLHGVHRNIVGGGWLKLRPGQVTDDTTMSLALGNAILARPDWSLNEVADHFVTWLRSMPVDCGNTCRRGIRRYMLEGTLEAPPNDGDAGNGALMRNLPVVIASLGDGAARDRRSREQARLTHHHPLSDAATLTFAALTDALIRGASMHQCRPIADALVAAYPKFDFERRGSRATGYVVDTVRTVLHHFFAGGSIEDCVVAVVNCGDDADTTGALAGMLAGARDGASALPDRWLQRLDPAIRRSIEEQVPRLLACSPLALSHPARRSTDDPGRVL